MGGAEVRVEEKSRKTNVKCEGLTEAIKRDRKRIKDKRPWGKKKEEEGCKMHQESSKESKMLGTFSWGLFTEPVTEMLGSTKGF